MRFKLGPTTRSFKQLFIAASIRSGHPTRDTHTNGALGLALG